jgi:hypothetical protein
MITPPGLPSGCPPWFARPAARAWAVAVANAYAACAVHSSLDRGQAYTTLELKVNIVKALTVSTPSVVATGRVVSAGRRVATASGQITGPDGTLDAHATTTCLVFEPSGAAEPPRPRENGQDRLPLTQRGGPV